MADGAPLSFARGTVPVVGMTNSQSEAVITNLIFSSMWMGAMGWELIMTLAFDWRLAKQTNWRSFPSALHSMSYYVSRYTTMTFLVVYVATNATAAPIMSTGACQSRITAGAAMFIASEMSVLLLFILRTIAIWNLNVRVIAGLTFAWLVTIGLGITIPAQGRGIILKGFCTWDMTGAWVGVSMIMYAVTSFGCLVLTVVKLNRQGWRGLLQSLVPPATRSIDAAEVSRLLVQRTTLFFFIVLLCIIAADVVYFTAPFVLWQLFAVPAYLTISCGLAGRIFRKSWALTHSAAYNRPPSYFPGAWTNETEDGSIGVAGRSLSTQAHIDQANKSHIRSTRPDDTPSFVEGEFRGASGGGSGLSIRSLGLPSREKRDSKSAAEMVAAEALFQRRASEPAKILQGQMNASDDVVIPLPGLAEDGIIAHPDDDEADGHNRPTGPTNSANAGAFGISEAPTFVPRAQRDLSSRIQSTRRVNSANADLDPPLFDGAVGRRKSKGAFASQHKSDGQKRPTTAPAQRVAARDDWSQPPTEEGTLTGAAIQMRDDLVPAPHRSRLWLDSSAERARMEAAAGASVTCLSDVGSAYSLSQSGASSPQSGSSVRSPRSTSTVAARRGAANKRLILESASVAGEDLQHNHTWRQRTQSANGGDEGEKQLAPQTSRSSFLPSPAIVSNASTADLLLDRNNYDFDAIRRTLTSAEQEWKPIGAQSAGAAVSTFPTRAAIAEEGVVRQQLMSKSSMMPRDSNGRRIRPRTAPTPASATSPLTAGSTALQDEPIAEDDDPLRAFQQAVDEDVARAVRKTPEERPRTSRGAGGFGSFGALAQDAPSPAAGSGSTRNSMRASRPSSNDGRPRTRNGEGSAVKPFGAARSLRTSDR